MHWENLERLRPTDEVKFVIRDRADYEYAREVVRKSRLTAQTAAVLFSPVHGVLTPRQLAEWMLADARPSALQLQAAQVHLGSADRASERRDCRRAARAAASIVHGRRDRAS